MKASIVKVFLLVGLVVILSGCDGQTNQLDQGWIPPAKITDSIDNLVGNVELYKLQNTVMSLQSLENGLNKCFFLNRTNDTWIESNPVTVPKGYLFFGTVDQVKKEILFQHAYLENQYQVMRVLTGELADNNGLQDIIESKWAGDKKLIFGETDTNVQLNGLYCGPGVIDNSNICLPYYAYGQTRRGKTIYDDEGPFNDGIFHSADSGVTWQMEQISNSQGFEPLLRKSRGCYYYFATRIANGYYLWFSRKAVGGNVWEKPETLTKTYATTYGHYTAVAEEDTIHVCWMDCRDNMRRFNLGGPNIENDDIYYCHRKDSDAEWGKEVLLSKGVLYCYSPSISIEGNDVVVAWSGISSAGKDHTEYDPNDIFYVTSKDGGNTWSTPSKVTDKAKDGVTSGKPQVMLLNRVIHLFYIQGTLEKPEQLLPGLTRLNKQPWPIYYTQRPFPN